MKLNTYIKDNNCLMNSLNSAYMLQNCRTLRKMRLQVLHTSIIAYTTRIRVYY